MLIGAGANLKVRDADGCTPMHSALIFNEGGYPECVRLLIEAGAEIDVKDLHGNTPLALAEDDPPSPECARLLREAGATR